MQRCNDDHLQGHLRGHFQTIMFVTEALSPLRTTDGVLTSFTFKIFKVRGVRLTGLCGNGTIICTAATDFLVYEKVVTKTVGIHPSVFYLFKYIFQNT